MTKAGDKIIAGLQEAVIVAPYVAVIERQREALRVAREAITDAREFTATTLARVGDGHRISELVADWDYAIDAIDAALKEGGE